VTVTGSFLAALSDSQARDMIALGHRRRFQAPATMRGLGWDRT